MLTVRLYGCYWYHKGKTFQANHNSFCHDNIVRDVVIDTTKVRLFKQITTYHLSYFLVTMGIVINTTKMVFLDEKDYLQGFL